MGLSIVGAISGTVAWYQYSTRATTSFVANSVGDSGLLKISTAADGTYMRDLPSTATGSTNDNKLSPVTFGKLGENKALPGTAYTSPEVGQASYSNWQTATKGKEYIQYDVYLKAVEFDDNGAETLVAKDVYLSDITIADATANKAVSDALRVHIAVDGGSNYLVSNTAVTNLELYGKLDLDGDGAADKVGGYNFNDGSDTTVIYGVDGDKQTTTGINDVKASRDSNGDFPSTEASKKLFTTSTSAATKVTITVWLEGWAQLNPYSGEGKDTDVKAIWDTTKTDGATVNIGLTFDVGRNAFVE